MAVDLMTPPGQGDAGEGDPRLLAALRSGDEGAVAAALPGARVFVGVESRLLELADPVDPAEQPAGACAAHERPAGGKPGLRGEKKSEMVLATLRLPSGATALPVFSSVAALSAWRSAARPVPVSAVDACAEASRLGHPTVVIDVAGPVTATLDVSALAGPVAAGPARRDPADAVPGSASMGADGPVR
ncbi:SseB family protein, partial [Frankia sp. CNm7]